MHDLQKNFFKKLCVFQAGELTQQHSLLTFYLYYFGSFPKQLFRHLLHLCVCVFPHVHMCGCAWVCECKCNNAYMEVKEQLVEVWFSLSQFWFCRYNFGYQVWWQVLNHIAVCLPNSLNMFINSHIQIHVKEAMFLKLSKGYNENVIWEHL